MRLRDKVAAMFDASGSSCSDESIEVPGAYQPGEYFQRSQEDAIDLTSQVSPNRPVSAHVSESSAVKALATPAPRKHPLPSSHSHIHISMGHGSISPFNLQNVLPENQQKGPHAPLLMLRKGALDGLISRHASVSKNTASLLIAASSLALPPGKANWEHVKTLMKQRRYITMLSRVVLNFDQQSPSLLLPRNYVSDNAEPPVFESSSDASKGLAVIHNWLVCYAFCAFRLVLLTDPTGGVHVDHRWPLLSRQDRL
jgi:hypothetical protein